MIKVTFFKSGDIYYGFRETGHAEYDDPGKDIVCAAVSAMTMLLINAIEVSYESKVEYSIDDDTAEVEVYAYGALGMNGVTAEQQYAISGLIKGYFLQLSDMLEDYYEFLEVNEEEA